MPTLQNTNNLYELNFDMFQLSEGIILLDALIGSTIRPGKV